MSTRRARARLWLAISTALAPSPSAAMFAAVTTPSSLYAGESAAIWPADKRWPSASSLVKAFRAETGTEVI